MPNYDADDELIRQTILDIHKIVLDLQQRQKQMEVRQQAIQKEVREIEEEAPPQTGSFATGYQKPK